jgi:hypothetical protein
MQPKPFPAEKREYIVNKKSFEEFWDFFQELTPPKKTHLSSSQMLPQPHGGFRPHTRELLRRQLRILWDDARKPENIQSSSGVWETLRIIWCEWVASHPDLNILLERYDNSAYFQGETIQDPNSNLDIECIKYLVYASTSDKISQEIIKKFYEFGFFKKEIALDVYVEMAKTSEEIERTREERSRIKKIEISIGEISKDVGSLYEESKKFSENINNVTYVIGNIDTLDQKLKTLNNFIEENIIQILKK